MHDITISLITVVYNSEQTIERCIQSVLSQDHPHLQYIIIDGNSSDGTLHIIDKYKDRIDIVVSGADNGIYDAMNKGLALANGEVIGTLNADDYFADDKILSQVATVFEHSGVDALYGDLDYVRPDGKVVRKWRSKAYQSGLFNSGWMPPHPTFYCRRSVFERLGNYDLRYGTAADYELMLRFIHLNNIHIVFLQKTMIKMSIGGVSNSSPGNRIQAWRFDYRAMRNNGVLFPALAILCKPLRKILQYIS